MKKIYMLNNSNGVIGLFLGLKSRITTFHSRIASDSNHSRSVCSPRTPSLFKAKSQLAFPQFCLASLILLMLGGFTTRAWARTISASGGGDCLNGNIVLANDTISVTFEPASGSFSGKDALTSYFDLDYYWIKLSKNSTNNVDLSWNCKTAGYSVKVTKIDFDVKLESNSQVTFYSQTFNTSGSHEYRKTNSSGFTSGMTIALKNTASGLGSKNREFQFSNISLTYDAIPKTYSITLDNETPTTSGSTSVTLTYDSNTHDAITNPTKDNYTFDGWWTGDNGTGSLVIAVDGTMQADVDGYTGDNGVWKKDATTTLYAKWILNSKTVTLDNQSATTAGTASITVFYNKSDNLTATPAITVPAKTGYTFEGYYTAKNGGGSQLINKNGNVNASVSGYTDANKKWIYDGNVTLYAYWKQNQTITWSQTITNQIRSNEITLTATAGSNLDVTYEVTAGSSHVTLSGNKITCLTAGSVTVTAHQTGNGSWEPAADVSKTFTIVEHAITTNPTASGELTYEQTLNTISPTGGVANVAGTWAWKNPTSVPGAGTANQVAVFTPTSSVISAYPLECNVSVKVNKANPDITCNIENTYMVDDDALDLHALWTREGDGVITYSKLSFTPTGSNNENATAPAISSNRYLSLGQAGTLRIQMDIAKGTNYNARTIYKDIEINKHTPVFTWNSGNKKYYYKTKTYDIFSTTSPNEYTFESSNPASAEAVKGVKDTLFVHNVEESATITVTQVEDYKWHGKVENYTITPVNQEKHVPFTLTNSNYSTFQYSTSSDAVWNTSNVGYRFGDWNVASQEANEAVIHFNGIPDKLYFDKSLEKSAGVLPYERYCAVYESANGTDWSDAIWENNVREEHTNNNVVQLSATTRYIKFYYDGTIHANYTNIRVTELKKFVADPAAIDFGLQGVKYGVQEQSLNFTHANAGRTASVSIEGDDAAYFDVTPKTLAGTGRDLTGMITYRVTFDNKEDRRGTASYNAELVFTDNLGHETRVPLTGQRDGKSIPAYTFNPNHLPYYFNSTIAHVALSTNTDYVNCPLSYSTTDAGIAYVDENGALHIGEKSGSVTITVRQTDENSDFLAGSATFTFTPRERPSLSTPFALNKAIYDDAVGAGSKCYWETSDGGRIRTGNTNIFVDDLIWVDEEKLYSVEFSGAPDKISFQYKCGNNLVTPPALSNGNHMFEVRESADGGTWTCAWYTDTKVTDWTNSPEIQLQPETRYLLFVYYGNYEGYWKNIKVTSFDGYKYMRAADGQYLSRGSKWGTKAVIDAFGVAGRITRSTTDNVNYLTQYQFVDNGQYLFEAEDHSIFTDNGSRTAINWTVTNEEGLMKVQSANDVANSQRGYYVTVNNGVLALTNDAAQATQWYMEDYTSHASYITELLDHQATAAAQYDFEGVTTIAGLRAQLRDNEYDFINIDIPAVSIAEQAGEYRTSESTNDVYEHGISGLVPGFYCLTVQAFYRMASVATAYNLYNANMESVVAYVFANEVKYPIKSIFDSSGRREVQAASGTDHLYPNGFYYADDLTAAAVSFENPNGYLNDVYVYVSADEGLETGTLRYGIKNPSYVDGAWLVYGNIQLKRLARAEFVFDPDGDGVYAWGDTANWNRDDKRMPTEHSAVLVKKNAEISGNAEVYSLTIAAGATVTIKSGAKLKIGDGNSMDRPGYGNLHVENGGKVVLQEGELLVDDFILDATLGDGSSAATSGQVTGDDNLHVSSDAYFQMSFDPSGAISYGWYDFTVPFPVNINGGIKRVNSANDKVMVCGQDFLIMEADEVNRANGGKGWRQISSGVLVPGKLYTITFDETVNQNTFRFTWNHSGEMSNGETYNAQCAPGTDESARGWNGMGNGMLRHGHLTSNYKMQAYDHSTNTYSLVTEDKTFAVGSAFFIQVETSGNVAWTAAEATEGRPLYAPRREAREVEEFRIGLRDEATGEIKDALFFSASDEATEAYRIGHDLLKMGTLTSSKIARMWATKGGKKLCDVEATLDNDNASAPLFFYTPKAGSYELTIDAAPADVALYLTYNDAIIWDLTASSYIIDLTKGTTSGYGLRMEVRSPQVATGVDNTSADGKVVRKVLINDKIYIVTPEGKMYDIVGKGVKF